MCVVCCDFGGAWDCKSQTFNRMGKKITSLIDDLHTLNFL